MAVNLEEVEVEQKNLVAETEEVEVAAGHTEGTDQKDNTEEDVVEAAS